MAGSLSIDIYVYRYLSSPTDWFDQADIILLAVMLINTIVIARHQYWSFGTARRQSRAFIRDAQAPLRTGHFDPSTAQLGGFDPNPFPNFVVAYKKPRPIGAWTGHTYGLWRNRELSFAGVEFSAVGELAEWPLATLCRVNRRTGGWNCDCCGSECHVRSPISGSGMNAPHISGFVECDADHPPLASSTQRHTVGDAGGDAFCAGQFVERNRHARFQRARQAHAAALSIQDESMSGLGELDRRIETGDAKGNLGADASATPGGFSRCFFVRGHDENVLTSLWPEGDLAQASRAGICTEVTFVA